MKQKSNEKEKPARFLLNLKAFRKAQDHALSDLLPYALSPEPGFVVNKDGSYLATWEFTGGDDESMTDIDRNSKSSRINRALNMLGSGWMYNINCVRKEVNVLSPSEDSYFSNKVSFLLDQERREYFEEAENSFNTNFYITLVYLPTRDVEAKAENFFFDVEGEEEKEAENQAEFHFQAFKKKALEFQDFLSVGLKLRKLGIRRCVSKNYTYYDEDEQITFLNGCVTGSFDKFAVVNPMSFLDIHIGKIILATGSIPKIGERFFSVLNIDGLPDITYPGLLNQICNLGLDFRWSTRFIPVSKFESEKIIKRYTGTWHQKAVGFLNFVQNKEPENRNEFADKMGHDSREAQAMNESGNVTFGYYTGNVMVFGDTAEETQDKANFIRQALMSLGIANARIEKINAVEAYLGSMPGNSFANIRRPIIHTRNLADLMPSSTNFAGEEFCPCDKYPPNSPPLAILSSSGNTPYWLNLHVEDIGHTLIFGPTGSGKSVLLAFLAMQMDRYENSRVFSFDKGMSMFIACRASGGVHYRVGSDAEGTTNFSPLSYLDTLEDQEWACDWIETLMVLQGIKPDLEHKSAIRLAIKETVDAKKQSNSSGVEHQLSEFAVTVQNADVKSVLDFYTALPYYNAYEDGFCSSNFQCFEIEELMNLPSAKSIPILLYILKSIEKSLDGEPTYIIIDEAWVLLGHEVFGEKIREWLKVLRKSNCAVILATQSISDAQRSGIIDVLNESCPTKIFLPNFSANADEFSDQYAALGVNETQRNIIANATPKKEYFVTSSVGNRKVDLALGFVALSICAKSSKKDIKLANDMMYEYGDDWISNWFEYCSSDYES